jgi:hypothetical protein
VTHWRYSKHVDLLALQTDRVDPEHAQRQTATAIEILRRLKERPGQILADEVGLGKTYTALAVASSIAIENPHAGPVVVMVPAALQEKWPIEWSVFSELYLSRTGVRHTVAHDGLDFLRVIDDPPESRAQLVFLPHGAFRRQLRDQWVKLALIRQVLLRRHGVEREWKAVRKFGAAVVGDTKLEKRRPGLVKELLDSPVSGWRRILTGWDEDPGDDPIPKALIDAVRHVDVAPLLAALRRLPTNRSAYADQKVRDVARALNKAIGALWDVWLGHADFRSPLLVLDEAHHAKNRETRLASLFDNEREQGGEPGALFGRFDRMLFLTATPFQLGHRELIEVLRRFGAVNWETLPGSRERFHRELDALNSALEVAQRATARLDERWGRLRVADVPKRAAWWRDANEHDHERVAQVRRALADADAAMRAAEGKLRPWVIRHRKPDQYPDGSDRRRYLRGAQILSPANTGGIDIDSDGLLPFLLAGRAQVAFQRAQTRREIPAGARSLFADGLCSSFEAYRDTRGGMALDEEAEHAEVNVNGQVVWYLDAISRALPDTGQKLAAHPKIDAVVQRAVQLWKDGEKVVVFCHFRKTGTALRRHISNAIDVQLRRSVAASFRVSEKDVPALLERIANRLYVRKDGTSPLAREAQRELTVIASESRTATDEQRGRLVDVLMRFLRSPVTLARYGGPLAEERNGSIAAVLNQERDGGSLRARFTEFVRFFDGRIAEEREELLQALEHVQTGRYHADRSELEGEDLEDTDREPLLPTVRLANGVVRKDARRRLLLAFNSPLLPDVLIASSVLAEGVDLHLECRHVIHHDLDWNPSTLEQRTGRIDRIGSLAERAGTPVTVFLPYLAATQDEKMYRVVRDRERWFQVVMGAKHELDETAIERIAERVPLPDGAARALAFNLSISSS